MMNQCSAPSCERLAITSIELRNLCLSHFINTCYAKLEVLSQSTHALSVGGTEWESTRTFLQECAQTATGLSQLNLELSNLERARLLDISFWAAELAQRF